MFINAKILIPKDANSAEYHKQSAKRGEKEFVMSSSQIALWLDRDCCPDKWRRGYERRKSDAMDFGNVVDTLVLTPSLFEKRYAVAPATFTEVGMECPSCKSVTNSKSCRACKCDRVEVKTESDWNGKSLFCKTWEAERIAEGREVISTQMFADAQAADKRLREDALIEYFLDSCDKQVLVTADWKDELTGVIIPCKALIDLVPREGTEFENCLGDLKTTKNASARAFENWAHDAMYHVRAAFYVDIFEAATKRRIDEFHFILSENYEPWQTGHRKMLDEKNADGSGKVVINPEDAFADLTVGRCHYRKMLADYCACLHSGKWPGYDDTDVSTQGVTVINPDSFREQRRMFAPKFVCATRAIEPEPETTIGITP